MELAELKKEKQILESQINTLLATFLHKYPEVKIGLDVEFIECRDVETRVVATCVHTNINLSL